MDKYLPADQPVTIRDYINYHNLIPGEDYTVKGVLMDRSTGKPLMIDGAEIRSEKTFTPTGNTGMENVEFTFNAAGLGGRSIVVFQELYRNGTLEAEHKNLQSDLQTVTIDSITLATAACDAESGAQSIVGKDELVILDRVDYTGLLHGRTYIMEGILMDYETGKPLMIDGKEVRQSQKFVPDHINGSVELTYPVNAKQTGYAKIVVFERLLSEDGTVLAVHEDLEDPGQTVTVTPKEVSPPTGIFTDHKTPMIMLAIAFLCSVIGISYKIIKYCKF